MWHLCTKLNKLHMKMWYYCKNSHRNLETQDPGNSVHIYYRTALLATAVADLGGAGSCPPPPPANFYHYHTVSAKISQNRFLLQTQGLAPPRLDYPGSATVTGLLFRLLSHYLNATYKGLLAANNAPNMVFLCAVRSCIYSLVI